MRCVPSVTVLEQAQLDAAGVPPTKPIANAWIWLDGSGRKICGTGQAPNGGYPEAAPKLVRSRW